TVGRLITDKKRRSLSVKKLPRMWLYRTLYAGHSFFFNKRRHSVFQQNLHLMALAEPALDELLRQRIADVLLNRPAHRAGAIVRLVAFLQEPLFDFFGHVKFHPALDQPLVQLVQQVVHDQDQVILIEGVEHHYFINAVEELRTEGVLELTHDLILQPPSGLAEAVLMESE